jgi:hypothetical protein
MKKAKSMKTGRVAVLPPSIYNNPKRMESGGWVIIEAPEPTLAAAPVATTAPAMPTVDTLTSELFDTVIEATEPKKPKKQKPTTDE